MVPQPQVSLGNLGSGEKQVFNLTTTNIMLCFGNSLLFTSFSEMLDSLSVKKAKCLCTQLSISLSRSKNYTSRFTYQKHNLLFSEEAYTYTPSKQESKQARTILRNHNRSQTQIDPSPTLKVFQHCPLYCLDYLAAVC